MSRSPKMISIDEERLERLISAIALASTGEIALALDQINPSEQDTLGVVEGAMNAFLSELAATTRQKEEALAALADSKREIEEKLEDLERCVTLTQAEGGEQHRYAQHHRDIVARFGRFPHRNAVLGRPSTPEEERFLAEGGFAG